MTRSNERLSIRRSSWAKASSVSVSGKKPDFTDNDSEDYESASEQPISTQVEETQTELIKVDSSGSIEDSFDSQSSSIAIRKVKPYTTKSGGSIMRILQVNSKDDLENASDFSAFSGNTSKVLFLPTSGSESPEASRDSLKNQSSEAPENQHQKESSEVLAVQGSDSPEASKSPDSDISKAPSDSDSGNAERLEYEGSESDDLEIVSVVDVPQEQKFFRKRTKDTFNKLQEKRFKTEPTEDSSSCSSPYNEEFSRTETDPDSTVSDSPTSIDLNSNTLTARTNGSSGSSKSRSLNMLSTHIDVDESEGSEAPHYATGNVSDAVVIDSEDESEAEEVAPQESNGPRSAVHLLKSLSDRVTNDQIQGINTDTVSIHDLVGASDLTETYQFNFSVDVEYFLTFLHKDFSAKKRKICFITGASVLKDHPLLKLFREKFNISEAIAPLPHRYASHHSKMMINVYENNEVEIVIMTSNLTQLDFGGLSQSVWRSGRLKEGDTHTELGNRFRSGLIEYLSRYGVSTTRYLLTRIEKLDFNPVNVELVASAPGSYDLQDVSETSEAYGFVKLRQVLKRNDLLIKNTTVKHNIASQVSSIASPYLCQKGKASSVFSHLLCPLMFSDWETLQPGGESFLHHQHDFNYKPHYVFPRTKDIAESCFGYLSGSAVHFNYMGTGAQKSQYSQNVKKYLYKWKTSGNITGREHLTPHSKYYVCDNGDDWKSLKWVLVGSHNLSKQAWGYPIAKSKGTKYEVSSYELSVLIPGGRFLVPTYKSDYLQSDEKDTLPIRLPFVLPPTKYSPSDLPWSNTADCGNRKDRYGNTYRGCT